MCVNSWACRASELVWSWWWKWLFSIISGLKYLFGTVTIYSDILFWTVLFKNSKLSINKNKTKQNDPCFPIFWVGRKRANKHLIYLFFFRPYNDNHFSEKISFPIYFNVQCYFPHVGTDCTHMQILWSIVFNQIHFRESVFIWLSSSIKGKISSSPYAAAWCVGILGLFKYSSCCHGDVTQRRRLVPIQDIPVWALSYVEHWTPFVWFVWACAFSCECVCKVP